LIVNKQRVFIGFFCYKKQKNRKNEEKYLVVLVSEIKKGIKKGEQVFTFFCPKSTMNLTYLCYGDTNLCVF
jgi:hypothetical protein